MGKHVYLEDEEMVCLACAIRPFKRTSKELSSVLKKISQNPNTLEKYSWETNRKDSIMGPPDRYLGVL